MAEHSEPEVQEELCPLCGGAAQQGCLLGGDDNSLQWFDGPPSLGKNLASGIGWPMGGEQIGTYMSAAGTYVEGIRCKTCRRIILAY